MRKILGIAVVLSVVGCGSSRIYLNRDVETVLVLIPFNESQGENEAPLKMWPYVEEQVARRGYRLVPRERVSAFYDAKKYTDPAQIGEWSHDELCKEFKVQAILISRLVAWDKKTLGVYNSIEVKLQAELRARDGSREGALVWNGEGEDGYSATAGGKGILQGLVGVAATDPVKYAPGAASRCFGGLPWAGWDPEVKKP